MTSDFIFTFKYQANFNIIIDYTYFFHSDGNLLNWKDYIVQDKTIG